MAKRTKTTVTVGTDQLIIGGETYDFTPQLLDFKVQYDGLTELQRAWFDAYVINRNGTLSAQQAGYKGGRTTLAHVASMNLEKMQHMLDTIDTYAKDMIQSVNDLAGIYKFWGETLADPKQGMQIRLKASELLARALGAFDNESGELNININTDKFDNIDQKALEAYVIENTGK